MDSRDFSNYMTQIIAALESAPADNLFQELVNLVHAGQDENFERSSDAYGRAWPLRKYHGHPVLDRGRSGVPGHDLLIDLGELRESVVDPTAPNHVEGFLGRVLETGTNIYYAAPHEYGTSIMPARPFIEISSEWIDRMVEPVLDWAIEIVVSAEMAV
jgi:phage gpG-like protein